MQQHTRIPVSGASAERINHREHKDHREYAIEVAAYPSIIALHENHLIFVFFVRFVVKNGA
jgi:hypothetical protein